LKIYLVDDNEKVLQTLELVFETAGFEVRAFTSPAAFLETKLDPEDSAILLDLRMPEISGLEVLKALKEQGHHIPVIIYSSHADVEATVQAFSDGAFTLIQKPISNNLLIDKVKHAIRQASLNKKIVSEKAHAKLLIEKLSRREFEIAQFLAKGESAPKIAMKIHLSPRTVETHRNNIFRKLEVNSTAEVARLFTLLEMH